VFDYIAPRANKLHLLDPTVHSQSSYVCDSSQETIVDHIFRFEDLGPLLDFFKSQGITRPVKIANSSTYAGDFDELMTPSVVKAIGEIYSDDVRRFGYADQIPVKKTDFQPASSYRVSASDATL
jgi:hypothetical protein